MKRQPLIIILIFSLCLCLNTVSASFTNEGWGEFQNDETNRGFVHDEYGLWDGIGSYNSVALGSAFQPLSIDWNNDGSQDVILFTTSFIAAYDKNLDLIDNINIGENILSQPTFYQNGSTNYLALITNGDYRTYSINSSNEIILTNLSSINTTGINVTGIKHAHGYNYFASQVNSTSFNFYKIRTSTLEIINSTLITGRVDHNPAIADMDIDSIDEIAVVCDKNNNGQWGLCVFDGDAGNLDLGFSADGVIDDLADKGDSSFITSPLFYNLDGTIDTELIIAYAKSGTCTGVANQYLPVITAYNSDGSIFFSTVTPSITTFPSCDVNDEQTYLSQPFMAINNDDALVCAYVGSSHGGTTTRRQVGCVNALNGLKNWSAGSLESDNPIDRGKDLKSGFAFSYESAMDIIVFGKFLYYANGLSLLNISSYIDDGDYNFLGNDVDGDGNIDIIASDSLITKIIYSNYTNMPPTLNNSYNYGGYTANYDYLSPICAGTNLIFEAQETGGIIQGNYDNDAAVDQERIATNCGYNNLTHVSLGIDYTSFMEYGNYTGANPSFECYYNNTGTFRVKLYLQDGVNDDDFTEYNAQTINVQVIANGIPGTSCNFVGLTIDDIGGEDDSSSETATNEAIDDTFGLLFGTGAGSDKLKMVIGLAIVIGIIVMAAQAGITNGMALIGIGLVSIIMVTFIGLLSPAILIVGLASMLLLFFIGKAVMGSDSGGP